MFPRAKSPRRPGFTLVELLIALTLLGLVMVLVYGAFGQISTRAAQLGEELTEQQELRLLMRMISDDLAAAQWLDRYYEKGVGFRTGIVADTEFLDGKDATRIRFHCARPVRFHRRLEAGRDPGLHEVEYRVRRAEEGEALQLIRREDFYLDDDLDNGGITAVLAENIDEFLVEFLPRTTDANVSEERWEKRWDANERTGSDRLPQAIRLTLGRKTAGGKKIREVIEFNLVESLKL